MNTKHRIAVTVAVAALLGSGATPPAVSAHPLDQDPPHAEAVRALVQLPSAMTLEAALEVSTEVGGAVRGYRYSNGPLVGEFYPTAAYTTADFLKDFAVKYDSAPRIVGIVADFDTEADAGAAESALPKSRSSFQPAAIDTSTLDRRLAEQTADTEVDRKEAKERAAARSSGGEWRADVVGAAVTEVENRVHITQALRWYGGYWGASPEETPDNYGFEIETDAYNDLDVDGLWPFCPAGAEEDFIAELDGANWSLYSAGNTSSTSDLANAQPWLDDPVGDDCSRQTYTIGIRYPHRIEPTEDGDYLVLAQIDAPRGNYPQNRISAAHQLVDDAECQAVEGMGMTPYLGLCMGYWQLLPTGVPSERMVLNGGRGWHAPDRCWRSDWIGEAPAEPLMTCGQAHVAAQVDVTSLAASPSPVSTPNGPGWEIEFIHEAGTTIDPTAAPYIGALPGLDPSFPSNNTLTNTVRDIRLWSHDVEIPVATYEGWEFAHDIQQGTVSLSSPGINLSRQEMREFLEDGWITFRMGYYGSRNWLRVADLGLYLPPDANTYWNVDPGTSQTTVTFSGDYVADRGWLGAFRSEPYTVHYTTWYDPWSGQRYVDRVWAEQYFTVDGITLTTADDQVLAGLDPACALDPVCPDTGTSLGIRWNLDVDWGVVSEWDLQGPFPGPYSLGTNQGWWIEDRVYEFAAPGDPMIAVGGRLTFIPRNMAPVMLEPIFSRAT